MRGRLVTGAQRFLAEEDGADAIEYGILALMIFLAILVAVDLVAARSTGLWTVIADAVTSAVAP